MITCKVNVSSHPIEGLPITLVSVGHPGLRFVAKTGIDGSISEWMLSGDSLHKTLYYALADGTRWVMIFPTLRFHPLPNVEIKIDTRPGTRHDVYLSFIQGHCFVHWTVTRAPLELPRSNITGDPLYKNSRLTAQSPLPDLLDPRPLPLSLPSPSPVPACRRTEETVVASSSAGRQVGDTPTLGVDNVSKVKNPGAGAMGALVSARRSNRLREKKTQKASLWLPERRRKER